MKFKLVRGNQKHQIRLQIDFLRAVVIIQFTAINRTQKQNETKHTGKKNLGYLQ